MVKGFEEGWGEEPSRNFNVTHGKDANNNDYVKVETPVKEPLEHHFASQSDLLPSNQDFSNINNENQPTTIKGITIYPALVVGKSFLLQEEEIIVQEQSTLNPKQEQERLDKAIAKISSELQEAIKVAQSQRQKIQAEIFNAHLTVLADDFLLNKSKEVIKNCKSAEFAWKIASLKTCEVLQKTNNKLLQERIADVKDIERSIILFLLGKEKTKLSFPENSIVITKDLVPSDLERFDKNVKGVVLAEGSATSHVSIMMKNNGIPSIAALGEEILQIQNDKNVVLDSKNEKVIFNPSNQEILDLQQQISKLDIKKQENLEQAKKPAVTKDGRRIMVMGNVGNIEQAQTAYGKGAEGIGLVRSEFLFFATKEAPTENEQLEVYQAICDAMHGQPVIVRTLDVGGDKPIAYMKLPKEENPIVGLRGVRNYYCNSEIFLNQIRALLRVTPTGICRIMLPMVSLISEINEIKAIIEEEKQKLGITSKIEIGSMIEVPAAAVMSEQFAKHLDFFSIGTNDLAQYTMAMDRGHSILTKQIENLNPAVLQMINLTVQGAEKYKIPVGVCGVMASEPESVPLLIGLGIEDLSVSRDLIPEIKALIRELEYEKCKDLATTAMQMESSNEVKTLIRKEFKELL